MISKKHFGYFAIAILVGLIFSFGLASMLHQPLPVQVQLSQYQPAQPPTPAIPTIVQTPPSKGNFDPASAPVVVTTAPLPTITPHPQTTHSGTCNINDPDQATAMSCMVQEVLNLIVAITPILITASVIGLMINMFNLVMRDI